MTFISDDPADLKPHVPSGRILTVAIVGLIVSTAARLIHYNQSLWCDEMEIPLIYAHAPWQQIVAARAGEYTPNNHILYTILTKAILGIAGNRPVETITVLIRLPSLIAGSLIPLMLAWPFRRRAPLLAILLMLFAAVEPWLIAFSDEARGYAMMALLGVVATNLLPDDRSRWPIAYAIAVALMIYTVPVAGMLLIAHGLTVMILRPTARRAWLRGAFVGGGAAALLLLPMAGGIWYYIRHPLPAPDSFIEFANQLPRLAMAGEYLPTELNPAQHASDPWWGIVYWVAPVLVLIAGSFYGWRQQALRVPIAAMGFATVLFVLAALVIPGAGQARFVPWCALWLVLALSGIAAEIYRRRGMVALASIVAALLCWCIYLDIVLLPSQPIREAIQQADAVAPGDAVISVGFLAGNDAVQLYGQCATRHRVSATPGPAEFLKAEQDGQRATGHSPWLILSYEAMVHDTAPRFWQYIQANYVCKARLPGRITPVAIYAPRN